MMDRLAQAELIREVIEIRDRCDRMLAVLIPDGEGEPVCPHPLDCIKDDSTFDEEQYTCTRCGVTQSTLFHTHEE